jgi:large subunit ribosomal protein L18
MKLKTRLDYLKRRHQRLRQKIVGTAARPRLCVRISRRHIYIQFIDDRRGITLAALATVQAAARGKLNVAAAGALGKQAAELAKEKGIRQVVFDRGGHRYNGRVKAIAEAVRAAGMKL